MQTVMPNHVAIIPDGNRRWARKRHLPSVAGHSEGAKNMERILRAALNLKIPYITFWGCSVSNLTERSRGEVNFLMKVFETYFRKLAGSKELGENRVRVRVLGRWEELLSTGAKEAARELVANTKNYDRYNLTLLMAYDGRDEMVRAVKELCEMGKTPTAKGLKKRLWTRDLPPVDLVIRTGGEPHWSAGFMMWDVADAQLYFTETLWPAFSGAEFRKAILEYASRERRLGK
jgi:undecaprenyl diphosphate synthase